MIVRSLLVVVVLLALAGPALAEPLDPAAYTDAIARALTAALPGRTVSATAPLELRLEGTDGGRAILSLSNLYGTYRRDQTLFDAIVATYVTALAAPAHASGAAGLDRSRIVPVVKERQWLLDNHRGFAARGTAQELLYEDLNRELVVVYAEDTDHRTRYLTTAEQIGVDRAALRDLAVGNLTRLLPNIEVKAQGNDVAMLSAGGDYEASLLLVDEIWTSGQIKVDGDIVVAVPAKDVLLVTGSRNRKGLKIVREMAVKLAAQERYRVSTALFVYRGGRFVPFGRRAAPVPAGQSPAAAAGQDDDPP